MIILASTSDLIRVVTSASIDVSVHTSSVDYNTVTLDVTPVRQNTLISTATTTTVVGSPASDVSRNVKYIAITNNHASTSLDVTIQHTDGTTVAEIWKQTLGAGKTITYSDDIGFSLNTKPNGFPSWYGNLYWAYGRCDPQQGLRMAQMAGTVAATPTGITTTVARIAYFRPPLDITVNRIRFYGVGTTISLYQCAIYDGTTLARLTSQLGTARTAVNNWHEFGDGTILDLKLKGEVLYFIAVSANAGGGTAGMLCVAPTIAATTGQIAVLPKSWPGNVDIDLGYMDGGFAQFATEDGALPNPASEIEVQSTWSGGFPLLLLDNSIS